MILPIYLYGSNILSKNCKNVDLESQELHSFIKNMFKTLKKSNGIGLAAPQVGRDVRLFIINTSFIKELSKDEKLKEVFINPHVISVSKEKYISNEGCLSIPFLSDVAVERYNEVKVGYYNNKLKYIERVLTGKLSIVFQHEFDHLEGVLLVDKLSLAQKLKYKKEIENLLTKNQITYSFETFEDILKFLMVLTKENKYLSYPSCLA
tara:strand:+ start:241 stop:861 length:621 start_codon:yes stop_codon:yes gene_type:complete